MHAPTVGGGGRRGIGGEENQIEWGHHAPGEMQLQAAAARIGHEEACVGRLQVQTAQHATVQVGFMCGSLPVPTETPSTITSSCTPFSPSRTALVPALNLLSQRTVAPRYRLLPTETDLNRPPSNGIHPELLLPVSAAAHDTGLCNAWEGGYLSQPMARRCETLAVSALTGYGDEIDVVASVDILKQIFKTPYCKSRLSVAVHRVGHTLILNSGPDIEEGEKIARRKKSHMKAMESSLFSKFVQHSVHHDTCDASDFRQTPEARGASSNMRPFENVPRGFASMESGRVPWQVVEEPISESASCCSEDDLRPAPQLSTRKGKQRVSLSRRNQCGGGIEFQKARFMREQNQDSEFVAKDPEKQSRPSRAEGFLRVLFWQFQNLRMLLGSDLLLFSNEKHAAVSLHLMEIERQVAPLMWLDAWLDNVMASIPEIAVCYHRNGVVQGYELLKTDDIFLLKGLSKDGTAFFHPHVVQQNASSVLRFLQENCKQDPGTYWKCGQNLGCEVRIGFAQDVVYYLIIFGQHQEQMMSMGSQNCQSVLFMMKLMVWNFVSDTQKLFKNAGEDLIQLFDLSLISKTCSTCEDKEDKSCGTLPSSRNHGNGQYSLPLAMLLYRLANRLSHSQDPADRRKCAKLFGKCLEFMDEQEHLVIRASAHEHAARLILACNEQMGSMLQPLCLESIDIDSAISTDCKRPALQLPSPPSKAASQDDPISGPIICDAEIPSKLAVPDLSPKIVKALAEPVSARLAVVHHISQAIKALRWQRQLQEVGGKPMNPESLAPPQNRHLQQLPECICGEVECVAICDFRDIEIGFGMDRKLWQLLLLLGESYLALGQAYKDDGQLGRALKAVELACLVRGSAPQLNTENSSTGLGNQRNELSVQLKSNKLRGAHVSRGRGLFWGQVWMLVGDVFAEIQRSLGETDLSLHQEASQCEELKMAQEVMKEVKRLKKKVGQFRGNCEICCLPSCSCQHDRASSGNSASSSSSPSRRGASAKYNRKPAKKSSGKPWMTADTPGICTDEKFSAEADVETIASRSSNSNDAPVAEVHKERLPTEPKAKGSTVKEPSPMVGTSKIDALPSRDIFSFLGRPLTVNWEMNFSAAADCYAAAVDAFVDLPECSQELESALRKKGWACNELGRRRLAHGDVKGAEAAFETAIVAFRAVKDLTNVVLVFCNLAHGRRAAAEKFSSQLAAWEECQVPQFLFAYTQALSEAKFLYQEALEFYGEGRRVLMGVGDGAECLMGGLWNEVHTQLAHTYLRLGMLLAREEKARAHKKFKEDQKPLEKVGRDETRGQKFLGTKTVISAKEAISKALVLYESMGSLRAQEAAYTQFQYACHQRDCCLAAMAMHTEECNFEKNNFERAKRFASMADHYWQKALEYYQAETHPDMFLQILMEKSAICSAVTPSTFPSTVLERALSTLLEGRRVFCTSDEKQGFKPSSDIVTKFVLQLQTLLRTMLGSAIAASKPIGNSHSRSFKNGDSSNPTDTHVSSSKASDISKLKEMYRSALMLKEEPDFGPLCNIWMS